MGSGAPAPSCSTTAAAGRTRGAGRAGPTRGGDAAGSGGAPSGTCAVAKQHLPESGRQQRCRPSPPHPSPCFGSNRGQGQQRWAETTLAGFCRGAALSPGRPYPLTAGVDLLFPARTNPVALQFSVDFPELRLCPRHCPPHPHPAPGPQQHHVAPQFPGCAPPTSLVRDACWAWGKEIQATWPQDILGPQLEASW